MTQSNLPLADSGSPFSKKNSLVYENSNIGCMVIKSLKKLPQQQSPGLKRQNSMRPDMPRTKKLSNAHLIKPLADKNSNETSHENIKLKRSDVLYMSK